MASKTGLPNGNPAWLSIIRNVTVQPANLAAQFLHSSNLTATV